MALTRLDKTGDGTTTVYDVDFDLGFISRGHVYVYLAGNTYTEQLSYTWLNNTQIQLDTPVTSGVDFAIRRVVPRDNIVNDYESGAILREKELDNSFKQAIMILQEIEDGYIEVEGTFVIGGDLQVDGEIEDGTGNILSEKMQKRPTAGQLNIVVFNEDGDSEDSGVNITGLTSGEGFAFTESKTLADGQVSVTFNTLDPLFARFVVCGDNVDNGALCAADYQTSAGSKTVTLTSSYPAGTVLMGIQNDQTADIETNVRYFTRPVTLAEAVANTNVQEGDTVIISDRGNGLFEYKSGQIDNGYNIVACTGVAGLSLVLQVSTLNDITQYGAVDGEDSTGAISAAMSVSNSIFIPPGTFLVGEVELPNKDIHVYSQEGTLQGTSGTHIFKRIKRGYLFTCEKVIFTGNSTAFDYTSDDASLPNVNQQYEYAIRNCRFLMAAAIPAIQLYGVREGIIDACYFKDNNSIVTEFSINTVVSNCQFKDCGYMVLSKLGSEGLVVTNAIALGCSYGIRGERTTGLIVSDSVIDYCDAPIYLQGTTDVLINNNYISTRTGAPAVHAVKYPDGFRGLDHTISNNIIIDNNPTTGSACIRYEENDFVTIKDNTLTNYASYGIVYTSLTQTKIQGNTTRERAGLGDNSILALVDDSSVRIMDNTLTQPLQRTSYGSTWDNTGFITENTGEAVASLGDSSVTFPHGLSFTPLKQNIQLTLTTVMADDYRYLVTAIDSSNIVISFTGVLTANVGIAWSAKSRA